MIRGKFGMVGTHSSCAASLQCFALFYSLWALVIFPSLALLLSPHCPEPSKQVCGPTRRERWSWSGEEDIPHHKILPFYFTMIFFFALNISQGYTYIHVKNKVSTFHLQKYCAIFLSLKNIQLTLHADFIFLIIPSTV